MEIKAGLLTRGLSNLSYHALRDDGTAACSSYLLVYPQGQASAVQPAQRCKSKACQKRFAAADAAAQPKEEG